MPRCCLERTASSSLRCVGRGQVVPGRFEGTVIEFIEQGLDPSFGIGRGHPPFRKAAEEHLATAG